MPKVDLQEILEAHEQPFVVIDAQYRIVAANRRYCESYGVAQESILNRRCHEISHHSSRPCHENGEQCPHQALFGSGQSTVVLHTHYHADNAPERTRIRGHAIRDLDGRLYLGEILYPLESSSELECKDMRMVGHSPAFLACVDNLARVAESEASVLLYGESGVGKELAARFVHDRSPRSSGPFIAINCAAVPENMFENELFGHERGAFTGSTGQKKGLYELADGGTLFLDEISEIPLGLQAKLLRVLETGEFRRVGGTRTLKADVRLVSATNRNLLEWVDRQLFRLDLYYRLAGIDVALPPGQGGAQRAQAPRFPRQRARTAQPAAARPGALQRRHHPRRGPGPGDGRQHRRGSLSRAAPRRAERGGTGLHPRPARKARRPPPHRRRPARHHRAHPVSQAQAAWIEVS